MFLFLLIIDRPRATAQVLGQASGYSTWPSTWAAFLKKTVKGRCQGSWIMRGYRRYVRLLLLHAGVAHRVRPGVAGSSAHQALASLSAVGDQWPGRDLELVVVLPSVHAQGERCLAGDE